jgi:hypothetical protein
MLNSERINEIEKQIKAKMGENWSIGFNTISRTVFIYTVMDYDDFYEKEDDYELVDHICSLFTIQNGIAWEYIQERTTQKIEIPKWLR